MVSAYTSGKFDIGLLRQDGTTKVGFMLAEDSRTKAPMYQEFDDEYLAQQFFTDTPGYGALPSEKEIAIRGDSWRSGFGMNVYDSADPERYFSSIGMDLRHKGMAIAGPLPATATLPTMPTITDGGLENWASAADLTSWTESASYATISQETSDQHGGVKAMKIEAVGGPSNTLVYQDAAGWSNNFRGKTMIVRAWLKSSTATVMTVSVTDGTDTTSTAHSGGGAWEQLTVKHTFNAAATMLRIQLKHIGASGTICLYDDVTIDSVLGVIKCFAEFNDNLYFSAGTCLLKCASSDGAVTFIYDLGTNITALKPFTDSKLYIALGTSATYYEMTTAEAFTINNLTVKTFQFFEVVHAAAPTMWGNDGVNTIRSTVNPAASGTQWSDQTTVDSSWNDITALLSKSGALYIMKEDMPYYLSSAGAVQSDLAPELLSLRATTSGKNALLWKNKLYIPCGDQGLLETDGTTNTFINPADFCTRNWDFVGRVQALAADELYLYAIVDNSAKIEVLAGREETVGSITGWVWHPIAEITLTGAETAMVAGVYKKRLWISSTSSADSLYYIPLTTQYGDIINDANMTFQTGAYFETPWLHGNFKDTTKAFPSIEVLLGHTYNANIFFECYYKKFEDSDYTDAGDLKGAAATMNATANRTATLYLPVDNAGAAPSSRMIRFKFTANTDDSGTTPELLSYKVTAMLYPPKRTLIACVVRAANELTLNDGTFDRGSTAYVKTVLDEARAATWPFSFYDIDAAMVSVKMLPLHSDTPRRVAIKDEKGRIKEWHYNLLLQVVTLS